MADDKEGPQEAGPSLYSPPKLVQSLERASANAGSLRVEGVFGAMAQSPVFMKEVMYVTGRVKRRAGEGTKQKVTGEKKTGYFEQANLW